jgi:hypothetical protein
MKFVEKKVSEKIPSVVLSIPSGMAILGEDANGNRQEGIMLDQVIRVPFPESELPSNAEKAHFFLSHVGFLVSKKKYRYHGHENMEGSLLAAYLDETYSAQPLPAVDPEPEAAKEPKQAKEKP